MANPIIAPIIPSLAPQNEAVAASQGVVFTATDRKIIEERGGEVKQRGSFIDVLSKRPLTPQVENEQTTVKPDQNVRELEDRYRDHQKALKHATLYNPQEKVEITGASPELTDAVVKPLLPPEPAEIERTEVAAKTIALAKELKLDPAALFDQFTLEQNELFQLISQIKELHLKRLLTDDPKEFQKLTKRIAADTLRAAKEEARPWLSERLEQLTKETESYKSKLKAALRKL